MPHMRRNETGHQRRKTITTDRRKAVILLSGGLDSATALGIAVAEGFECFPMTFDYGQIHDREVRSAIEVAASYACGPCNIVTISGLEGGPSALINRRIPVPRRCNESFVKEIPVTYVPARNSIFLAMAMAYAESINAHSIFTGFNAVDYSGYPDCRPEFVLAMMKALNLGTKRGIEGNPVVFRTPLIELTKVQIIEKALELAVPLGRTWSCYVGDAKPCGECDSCIIRSNAFKQLGKKDPALC